jgi:hypothetical protein
VAGGRRAGPSRLVGAGWRRHCCTAAASITTTTIIIIINVTLLLYKIRALMGIIIIALRTIHIL